MSGNLTIDTGVTGSIGEMARVILGNNKATGADGKSHGSVLIYGDGGYFANITAAETMTSNRIVRCPDNTGTIALRSDLGVCDTLLDEKNIPTTFTSYNCNWNLYYFILLESTFYGNARDQILVPTSYFSGTSDGRRPTINDSGVNRSYEVYQNGNDKVYIKSNSTSDIYGILIYGIMKK